MFIQKAIITFMLISVYLMHIGIAEKESQQPSESQRACAPYLPDNFSKTTSSHWIILGLNHPYNWSGAGFLLPSPPVDQQQRPILYEHDMRNSIFFRSGTELTWLCQKLNIQMNQITSLLSDDPLLIKNKVLRNYTFPVFGRDFSDEAIESSPIPDHIASTNKIIILRCPLAGLNSSGIAFFAAQQHTSKLIRTSYFFHDWDECRFLLKSLIHNQPMAIQIPINEYMVPLEYKSDVFTTFQKDEVPADFRKHVLNMSDVGVENSVREKEQGK